nr:retrovirus-related Pol polyprotein from transposon TNT 1-94 [Tanacetum cinerariifolium]
DQGEGMRCHGSVLDDLEGLGRDQGEGMRCHASLLAELEGLGRLFGGLGNELCKLEELELKDITKILEFKTSKDRYGDDGMSDSTGVSVSLGEIFLEGNKSWESNIGDSDNTGDGGKIAGRAITTWGGGMLNASHYNGDNCNEYNYHGKQENYVPWSSRLLRYAKSRPNGKLIHNFILNGPYVRRMIPEPGNAERDVNVNETFHEQKDDELSERELKQIEADDQAIQTILLGLPEDIYAAVDSCETAQEIWLRVQQMMKGSDIGIQEKKAKLFNEWMNDLLDDNNFFIFDDVNVRISPVSKMPFRKKPSDSMHIVQIYLWIIDSRCSKHMTGPRSRLSKSTCFVRNEDGVDLLIGDRSLNLYSIALNEVASNSSTCLLANASSLQSWLWHQRLSHLNFARINNLVKNNLVQAARTPQQNEVVERRNQTLVEAARTMLTFANQPSFLWAVAIATACFTQNHSIIHKRFDKTPYELINKRKPNIKFFHVFGCRCYLLNDYKDVGKLKAKGNIRVFVGYSKESAAFRIYNKRTRKIHESVNVNFDEIS